MRAAANIQPSADTVKEGKSAAGSLVGFEFQIDCSETECVSKDADECPVCHFPYCPEHMKKHGCAPPSSSSSSLSSSSTSSLSLSSLSSSSSVVEEKKETKMEDKKEKPVAVAAMPSSSSSVAKSTPMPKESISSSSASMSTSSVESAISASVVKEDDGDETEPEDEDDDDEPCPEAETVKAIQEITSLRDCQRAFARLALSDLLNRNDIQSLIDKSKNLLELEEMERYHAVDNKELGEKPLKNVVVAILRAMPGEPFTKALMARFGKTRVSVIGQISKSYLAECIFTQAKDDEAKLLIKIKFFVLALSYGDSKAAMKAFDIDETTGNVHSSTIRAICRRYDKLATSDAVALFKNLTSSPESKLELLGDMIKKRKSPPKEAEEAEEVKEAKEVKIPQKKAEKPKKSSLTLDDLVDFVVTSIDEASKKKFPCNCALVAMMGVHYMDIARLDKSEKETIQGMRNVLKTYAAREPTADVWFKAVLTDLDDAGSLSFLHKKTADKFIADQLCDKLMENVLIKARVDHDFVVLLKDETPRKRQKKTKADVKEEPIEIDEEESSNGLVLSPKEDAKKS